MRFLEQFGGLNEGYALLCELLGAPDSEHPVPSMSPEERQRRFMDWERLSYEGINKSVCQVAVAEDVHWIDAGSAAILNDFIRWTPDHRQMILVTQRPDYTPPWITKSFYRQIPLLPLGDDAVDDLSATLLGPELANSGLDRLIRDRCAGTPFFIEETIQSLAESGYLEGERGKYALVKPVDEIPLPATVQSVLAARIDRLEEHAKHVLQTASIIGRVFPLQILKSISDVTESEIDASLQILLDAELIYEHSIHPDLEYIFKHALTQDVAYASQLRERRESVHVRVADALEQHYSNQIEEKAALIGQHLAAAGEALEAARWYVRAARWTRVNDLRASSELLARARGLLVALPDTGEKVELLLEVYPELLDTLDRVGVDPVEAETVFREAVEHARKAGDRYTEALLEADYSQLKSSHNDFESMIEHASRAIELADAEGDLPIGLLARHFLGRGYAWLSRWNEAIAIFDESIAIAGGDEAAEIEVLGWRPYVESLAIRAACLSISGRVQEAFELTERFPQLLHRSGVDADISSPACDRFWPCWIAGDAARARVYSEEALEMAERFGSDRNIVYALTVCGNASTLGLRWEEGRGFLERARERIAATGAGGEWSILANAFLALCLAELGETTRSVELVKRGLEQAPNDFATVTMGVVGARVLRTVNGSAGLEELAAHISMTLEALLRTDATAYVPMLLLERAGLAKLGGDEAGMKDDLSEARRLFADLGITGWNEYARSIED